MLKFISSSSFFFNSNCKDAWTQVAVELAVDDTLVWQTTEFICCQVFCQPIHSVLNIDLPTHDLLTLVSKGLEVVLVVQGCVKSVYFSGFVVLQKVMSAYSDELIIRLQTFVHEYEDCHKQKSTDCNPRPGDDVVCILLCELVKLCQAITVSTLFFAYILI